MPTDVSNDLLIIISILLGKDSALRWSERKSMGTPSANPSSMATNFVAYKMPEKKYTANKHTQ
jgi:hypothetical protein